MRLSLDFETYYDDICTLKKLTTPEYIAHPDFAVHMVGIYDGNTAMVYTEDDIRAYFNVLDWAEIDLICHNALFDGYILKTVYGVEPRSFIDTAAMARGWWSNRSAALEDVAKRLWPNDPNMHKGTELSNSKGVRKLEGELLASIANYCAKDAFIAWHIAHRLLELGFPVAELANINDITKLFTNPVLHLDTELVQQTLDQVVDERQEAIDEALNYLIERLPLVDLGVVTQKEIDKGHTYKVLSSNDRFVKVLDALHPDIEIPMKMGKNGPIPALGKNDLGFKELQDNYPHLDWLWEARIAIKSTSYIGRCRRFLLIAEATGGLLPVPLRFSGAHTHRLAGADRVNLQNLQRGSKLRSAIVAPPGYVLVGRDLSAIEARMLAWMANHEELLDVFRRGDDVYCWFASKLYNRAITKADKLERMVGKVCILGLGYGLGSEKFWALMNAGPLGADPIPISLGEAQEIVRMYRDINFPIKQLWQMAQELLIAMMNHNCDHWLGVLNIKHGVVWGPRGLPIRYDGLHVDQNNEMLFYSRGGTNRIYGGKAIENWDQHLSSDVIMTIHRRIMDRYAAAGFTDVRWVMQVHDELVYCVPEADGEAFDKFMEQCFNEPIDWCPELPLASEGGIGKSYGDLK